MTVPPLASIITGIASGDYPSEIHCTNAAVVTPDGGSTSGADFRDGSPAEDDNGDNVGNKDELIDRFLNLRFDDRVLETATLTASFSDRKRKIHPFVLNLWPATGSSRTASAPASRRLRARLCS